MKTLEYRNRIFDYHLLLLQTEVIAFHCNTSLFWDGKIYKMLVTIQGFMVASKVAQFFT